MPANSGVDERCACGFNGLRQLHCFCKSAAFFHQIKHRQAVDNNKVVPHPLTHRTYHFNGKAHTIGIITAPFIVALIGAQGEKLVNQVPFRAHDLHAVVTRLPCQLGTVREVFYQLQNFFVAQCVRGKPVDGGLNCGRGYQLWLIAVAPGMQDL